MSVSVKDVVDADRRISSYIRRTPVMEIDPGDLGIEWRGRLTLKLECLQHAGSFKPRGAFNSLLAQNVQQPVAAASGGNHGAAVAFAAQKLGLEATIFVPEISSPAKIAKIRDTGCDLRVGGANYAEALAACQAFQAETGAIDIHAYDAVHTIAGQGTVGLEWQEQCPDLDAVFIAAGGGGLIAGVGVACYTGPSVIGVEPEGAAAMHAAREARAPVKINVSSVAADSLGATSIGRLNHDLIDSFVDDIALVTDEAIIEAQRRLWRSCGVAAEPGGAAALAALISGRARVDSGAHIGVLVCGSNLDPSTLAS